MNTVKEEKWRRYQRAKRRHFRKHGYGYSTRKLSLLGRLRKTLKLPPRSK